MGVIERRSQIDVSVIKDMGALMQAMAIRSAVFIGEFGCGHDEEFDGNDFSATHIIAKVGGEPAGTMRLRYFADFVIPERLAVLPAFRKGRYGERGVAYALATFGFKLARMKGYRRFIGYSVLGLEQFWDRVAVASGGKVDRFGDHPIECSGSTCVGVFGSLEPMPGAIHPREDYHVLTACEAELPQHVGAKAEMLHSLSGESLLAALTHPGRRHTDHRADPRVEARVGDRRASDRRDADRRGNDRRAADRRGNEQRSNAFAMAAMGQDQRFGERRAFDRRAGDRRMADRRATGTAADRAPAQSEVQAA
ncbi:GNAT family N-acetyltransferase [Dongia rigui]|uniref:N-acetyltransferase domain-containing protein n=1 Tax=Dongia rigui TaxID=940149 RepID=A0ABU5DV41_9PROT|nr:hypothetical protein [Dongia rigui]MDY0871193.1 hypothetical protein [Dongia rigui]